MRSEGCGCRQIFEASQCQWEERALNSDKACSTLGRACEVIPEQVANTRIEQGRGLV